MQRFDGKFPNILIYRAEYAPAQINNSWFYIEINTQYRETVFVPFYFVILKQAIAS